MSKNQSRTLELVFFALLKTNTIEHYLTMQMKEFLKSIQKGAEKFIDFARCWENYSMHDFTSKNPKSKFTVHGFGVYIYRTWGSDGGCSLMLFKPLMKLILCHS